MSGEDRLGEDGVAVEPPPLLELAHIVKAFPGSLANDDVSLHILPGEIHALLGENGAGKSTLVKIIYGVVKADAGTLIWRGQGIDIASPKIARRLGIGMVFQHFSLFDALTVAENIALGIAYRGDMAALERRIDEVAADYGLALRPDAVVHGLSVGERQRVEIARCLLQDPKLLIMDEPTSVLTPQEAEALFETLRRLAREGCAILYISHKLDEIMALCERATIMRLGRVVSECDPRGETARALAEMMLGDALATPERHEATPPGQARLIVERLSLAAEERFGVDLRDVSFTVRAGEILGIGGIAGNGQGELFAGLSGETRVTPASAIRIDGVAVGRLGPGARRALHAAFIPEQRHGHAAVSDMTLAENGFLSGGREHGLAHWGLIDGAATDAYAERVIKAFDVRANGPRAEARSLSGGNLQKFIVGRELEREPAILIAEQPTWGVDAGAAATIHQALLDLAAGGAAVVVISQDLDEIFAICDRIAVLAHGRLSPARAIDAVTVEEIGLLMGGAEVVA